jgi:hypothetical protein
MRKKVTGQKGSPRRYIAQRAARANLPKALAILKRAGAGGAPVEGDELPVSRRRIR